MFVESHDPSLALSADVANCAESALPTARHGFPRMSDLKQQLQTALGNAYTLERELGGGGMSRVFAAREQSLNRIVVIKVLSTDAAAGVSLDRFTREIQVVASLQQANIVPLISAGDANGVPYYTMPYVPGESLRGRLAAGPPLTVAECVGILRDVARALSYAHARGVVHRDIKPDNVLISHGTAMVTDFGIAKAVSASRTLDGSATLTQMGMSIGTPAYMAPEQIAGDRDVDQRADIYAWGCLAYELLAGEPPFVRDSTQRVLAAHLSETPGALSKRRADTPPSLERLVMRCLAKEPSLRPASADEILRELDAVFTPSAAPFESPAHGTPRPNKSWHNAGIVAAVVLVLAATAFAINRGRASSATSATSAAALDRSIAVLPLTNLGGDKSDDYFGIGLTEEMTRALAKAGVRVIGRASAGALQAKGLDERAIAKELGVGSLLTGSVQRADGKIRISVTLSAADGAVRWTQAYNRPIANIFDVQDEIAREVAHELLGSLGVGAAGTLLHTETADAEAHANLLQGIVLWNRRTAPTVRQAITLFEKAAARDPKYARAQAWLALGYAALIFYVDDETDVLLDRATAAADRAIAMDSTIGEAYAASAMALAVRWQNRDADARFRQALSRDSTLATSWFWYGLLAVHQGRFNDAQYRMFRARELEPASLVIRSGIIQLMLVQSQFFVADTAAAHLLALDSTFALTWQVRTEAAVGLGRVGNAINDYEQHLLRQPGIRPVEQQGRFAWMLAVAGRTAQARSEIEQLKSTNGGKMPPVGIIAAALERLGDVNGALAVLADAIAKHDPWLLQYSHNPRFDRLRKDPRGLALMLKLDG